MNISPPLYTAPRHPNLYPSHLWHPAFPQTQSVTGTVKQHFLLWALTKAIHTYVVDICAWWWASIVKSHRSISYNYKGWLSSRTWFSYNVLEQERQGLLHGVANHTHTYRQTDTHVQTHTHTHTHTHWAYCLILVRCDPHNPLSLVLLPLCVYRSVTQWEEVAATEKLKHPSCQT